MDFVRHTPSLFWTVCCFCIQLQGSTGRGKKVEEIWDVGLCRLEDTLSNLFFFFLVHKYLKVYAMTKHLFNNSFMNN